MLAEASGEPRAQNDVNAIAPSPLPARLTSRSANLTASAAAAALTTILGIPSDLAASPVRSSKSAVAAAKVVHADVELMVNVTGSRECLRFPNGKKEGDSLVKRTTGGTNA